MPSNTASSQPTIAIIGAGPAGLMAADVIAKAGYTVQVFDAMPSVARKFLLAGVGGMNITHAEDYADFVSRYGDAQTALQPILDELPPQQLRQWIHELGVDTFVGSSQRVFPTDMKAAPLLRAWLRRLRELGVAFHPRHRWLGWPDNKPAKGWQFESPNGLHTLNFDAVVLALGGGSWRKLGSDGRWVEPLGNAGIPVCPLLPSNCGFEIPWSHYLTTRFAGTPLKNVGLSLTDKDGKHWARTGELIISEYGIEGSLVYALSGPLRDLLNDRLNKGKTNQRDASNLLLDWLPQSTLEQVQTKLQRRRKGMSIANVLRKQFKLPNIANALLRECCPDVDIHNPIALAQTLKAMPLCPVAPRPIDEAISSAGGISFAALNNELMLNQLPGVFAAGEMLDWEAPTGGYLLTACFATGKRAGLGVVNWLGQPERSH